MSYNARVCKQAQAVGKAYDQFGFNSKQHQQAKEAYWATFEEEAKKDVQGFMGWAGWEDPADCLLGSLDSNDSADWVEYVLKDYLKYGEIISRVTGKDLYNCIIKSLVDRAEAYITK